MDYKYTLIFLTHLDKVLMLNAVKGMWMGMWNGVGGKIELDETPKEGAIREVFEETGIEVDDLDFHTIVTWEVIDKNDSGGMYIFTKEIDDISNIKTPYYSPGKEGILDWKTTKWIFDPNNQGVIKNIQFFLKDIIKGKVFSRYHCIYQDHTLLEIKTYDE